MMEKTNTQAAKEKQTLLLAVEANMRRLGIKEDREKAERAVDILYRTERKAGSVVPESRMIEAAIRAAGAETEAERHHSNEAHTLFENGLFVPYPGDVAMEKMKIQDGPRWVSLKAYSDSRPFGPYVFWDYSFTEKYMAEHPELFVYTLIETKRGREIVNGYSPVNRIGHFFSKEDLCLGPGDCILIEAM